jgi:hypothetical protein
LQFISWSRLKLIAQYRVTVLAGSEFPPLRLKPFAAALFTKSAHAFIGKFIPFAFVKEFIDEVGHSAERSEKPITAKKSTASPDSAAAMAMTISSI